MNEMLQIALPTPSKLGANGVHKLNNELIVVDDKMKKGKTADVLFVTTPVNFKVISTNL